MTVLIDPNELIASSLNVAIADADVVLNQGLQITFRKNTASEGEVAEAIDNALGRP